MDISQYLDLFLDESREHIQNMNSGLLELENSHGNLDVVSEIFRSAHTLKGMAGSMGYQNMAGLTHQLENLLDGIRNNEITVSTIIIDALFEAADQLEEMINLITDGGSDSVEINEMIEKLKLAAGQTTGEQPLKTNNNIEQKNDDVLSSVMDQAKEQGFNVWEVEVVVSKDCMLKAARAYMVFEVIEQIGDIIETHPSTEALQDGNYDKSFVVNLITSDSEEEVREKIMKVSEIDDVLVKQPSLKEKQPEAKSNGNNTNQSKVKSQTSSPAKKAKQAHKTIRVNTERLDDLMNLFEELIINKGRLEEISKNLDHQDLEETVESISTTSSRLQDIILTLRMEPVEQVFNRFPKMVRSVSKELGKIINLEMIGVDTELDRNVIDEIGDPLVHLIRNSMDHGIETPDIRKSNGKSEEGHIALSAYHHGNNVYIEIQDDGAGINRTKIKDKAVDKGLITNEEAEHLADNEIFDLMFHSGFSTADKISDISGRGVGLDVVKNKIESLGGTVNVDSKEGIGSTFTIKLPLTMSIISAMLVKVQRETYAIPLNSIVETALITQEDVFNTHGNEMIEYRERVIPFMRLEKVLKVPNQDDAQHQKFIPAVIAQSGKGLAAFAVDRFIGQQEVVIKALGNYLGDVQPITGATILGNGQVALILDCAAMINNKESGQGVR